MSEKKKKKTSKEKKKFHSLFFPFFIICFQFSNHFCSKGELEYAVVFDDGILTRLLNFF